MRLIQNIDIGACTADMTSTVPLSSEECIWQQLFLLMNNSWVHFWP